MTIERKLKSIPKPLLITLLLIATLQFAVTWVAQNQKNIAYTRLDKPLNNNVYKLISLDSNLLIAHLLTLKLQLHDNQQGRHMSYRHVSYDLLSQWLLQLQIMNTGSEYPALLAARVFSNTPNKQQLHQMLIVVIKLFNINPQKNWRWMAEGAVIAKYHLNDLSLALKMAKKIAQQPKNKVIPAWARDLEFIMLEELNLIEAATYIVEQSLMDDSDMHPDEKRFLKQRLSVLKQKSVGNMTKNKP